MKLIHARLGKKLGTEYKNRLKQEVKPKLEEKVVIGYKYMFAYTFYLAINKFYHNPEIMDFYTDNFSIRKERSSNIIWITCDNLYGMAGGIRIQLPLDELEIEYKTEPHLIPKRFRIRGPFYEGPYYETDSHTLREELGD